MSLWTLFALVELAYVIPLAIVIVLEKRPPLATIAWLLGLAVLPVAGFAVWFLLGPRRLRRRRTRREEMRRRMRVSFDAWDVLRGESRGTLSDRVDAWERQLIALGLNGSAAPVSGGNEVTVLLNGTNTFRALAEAIRAARHHVHVEYYIFADDRIGRRFRDLLIEKAREGVEVRLLVDAVGSIWLRSTFLKPLIDAGGEVGFFNPVAFTRWRPALNLRNHRKIVVVDGEVGFTGGINVGDEYAGLDPSVGHWRDTHVRLRGPAVKGLQLVFLEDWSFTTGKGVSGPDYFRQVPQVGDEIVQVCASGPDDLWSSTEQMLFAAITGARDRIRLTTPYFVPDGPVLRALETAALRGIDIELLVPRRSDSRVVTAAARSYYDELLKAGMHIREYLPGMLHAKTMTVDGHLAFIGTANLDVRSFRLNYEVTAVIYGRETAAELDAAFEHDRLFSREITLDDRTNMRMRDRLLEASARLLSPLL